MRHETRSEDWLSIKSSNFTVQNITGI